jgi:hypothetical protein
MTVTRSQFLSLMEPILSDILSDADYQRRERIYSRYYKDQTETPKKRQYTFFQYGGLGDYQVKNEGGPVSYTDPIAGPELTMAPIRFSNGYKVTQEMFDHDQFGEIRKLEAELRRATDDFLEVRGHLLLNNGFGTTASAGFIAAGFDGVALFSTAHTRLDGGTNQANRPTTDASLDWTSLANGVLQFQLWNDERGRPILSLPSTLVIHVNDSLTARELLGSELKPGTANNELNALRGMLSETVVSPYITDTNAWYLKSADHSAIWKWDVPPRSAMEDDFDLEVVKRKTVLGFCHGATDWRGWYGTNGTT